MKQDVVRNHHGLRVWQLGMELAEDIYRHTLQLPIEERYGFTTQIRRAAVAIPANIAEGAGRDTAPDFARFISIARGSLGELETHLLLCERLGLLMRHEDIHQKIRGLRIMLTALKRSLQA